MKPLHAKDVKPRMKISVNGSRSMVVKQINPTTGSWSGKKVWEFYGLYGNFLIAYEDDHITTRI